MARNKYPEETVQKIEEIALRLFLEKGYNQTSIQDIVDELGMSKGAIYHHFKNKEDILTHACERYYSDISWFTGILEDDTLNALQKIRRMFLFAIQDSKKVEMDSLSMPLMKNPMMLTNQLQSGVEEVAPMIQEIIEIGNRDGSTHVKQPREAAEAVILLINLWLHPGIFLVSRERFMQKVIFLKEMTDNLGMPILDQELWDACGAYYEKMKRGIGEV